MEHLKQKCDYALSLLPQYAHYFDLNGCEVAGGILPDEEDGGGAGAPLFFAYSMREEDCHYIGMDEGLLSELTVREIALVTLANLAARKSGSAVPSGMETAR
ncbi:hypothetical protein [Paenibacillus tarimensis]|uniref:hypothetical protein n=1 Tax=Paenibacillus tarimensis TaxID=416012 RepID=UPI001F245D86|nr:hypothetical protein [Paenibacillus tarimensis]MCF2944639.1 hypothetical protein [Paenibacillus tarimensis]